MSKSHSAPSTVASTLASIAGDISSVSLDKVERQRLRTRNEIVPDQLIEMICHLAEQGGGSVLGMPFDATLATATLKQTSDARTTISVGQQTLQRMEDDMLQQRIAVADPAFAIYRALQRLVKTKAGNALSPAYEQMKAIVKTRPRRARKKAAQAPVATTTPVAPAAPTPPASPAQAPAPKAVAATSN